MECSHWYFLFATWTAAVEDIVVDIYNTEQQCLYSMDDQRIRHGGCFPVEDFIDGFWLPARQYSDF